MKTKIITLLACLMTSPGIAGQNVPYYELSEVRYSTKVPAKYLYMYQGKLNPYPYRTRREVRLACANLGRRAGYGPVHSDFGCAVWNGNRSACTIVFLIGKPHVYWHEIAHCNGHEHE